MPKIGNNLSSQVIEIQNEIFLVDCGEGTQVGLRTNKIKFSRIKHIFISHLHGDHYFGLIGLISTFSLLNRSADLHVYGPIGIKELIINQIKASGSWTKYKLIFHELSSNEPELIFITDHVVVSTIPLSHRIYTNGFLFKEVNLPLTLNIDAIEKNNVSIAYSNKLKQGFDVVNEKGYTIKNKTLTYPGKVAKSYAYCSDTEYDESIIELINNCDALYHESTFLDKHIKLSKSTKHSTAKQAGKIAKLSNVKLLILGHYSSRYDNIDDFKIEAKTEFENVVLAEDNKIIEI
jgi:ribonuclease Z